MPRIARTPALALAFLAMLGASGAARALAVAGDWSAARGAAELAAIEARWKAVAAQPRRDARALAELEERARDLSRQAARALGAMREAAAERDGDMAALVGGPEWVATEELIVELRFRIAAIQLDRALAGGPERMQLARAAADGFSDFVDAPDGNVAAEARYGRGLARIALGEREAGIADLRAAAAAPSTSARARLALAEALADAGRRGEALDLVTRQLAGGGLPRDGELRAKLLRLRLLVAGGEKGGAASGDRHQAAAALAADLVAAGEPWRGAAFALLEGQEHLLPAGAGTDAVALRKRADALARSGDGQRALEGYRAALAKEPPPGDPATLAGLARAAVNAGEWQEAESALARLREAGAPATRDLALLELRAAHGAWQAAPGDATARRLAAAAGALRAAPGATRAERAEADYRSAEAARASGDLARAISLFAAIDDPAWRVAGQSAALQSRALRRVRDPAAEPRDPLLRDLAAWLARPDLPAEARAVAIALDGTLRTSGGDVTTGAPPGTPPAASAGAATAPVAESPLAPAAQRAALARLRDFPRAHPTSTSLLPAVLRARALLEVELDEPTGPALLDAAPPAERAAIAAAIADDLAAEVARGASAGDEAARARARRALVAAVAFAAASAPESGRGASARLDLAGAALALGEPGIAEALYGAELAERPRSLSALRGAALAAAATGDRERTRAAWQRLAEQPDLPPALRDEAARGLGK